MPIIADPSERLQRQEAKRRYLLGFLRAEIWTTPDIAGEVMGIAHPTTIRNTLRGMVADGLLISATVETPRGPRQLVGITAHGQAIATPTGKLPENRIFEPSKVGLTTFQHTLDMQRVKIACLLSGWRSWQNQDRIKPKERSGIIVQTKKIKRPDVIVTHPSGKAVALEVERTLKQRARYTGIVAGHLTAIQQGKFQHAIWVTPDQASADLLTMVFQNIRTLLIAGVTAVVTPEHRACIHVVTYQALPTIQL